MVGTALPLVVGAALLANVDRGDTAVQVTAPDGQVVIGMTPAEAEADEPRLVPECHTDQGDPGAPIGCAVGDPAGDYSVVLLGDSHARQWIDALDAVGRREGWRVHVWTKSSCTIVDAHTYLSTQERAYDDCDEWRVHVRERIAELDHVDEILFTRAAGVRRMILDGDRLLDPSEIGPLWSAAFGRTLAQFQTLADQVTFLSDTPWPGFKPPACLSEHGGDPEECTFTLAGTVVDDDLLAIERPIAGAAGVRIVDPRPLVCPDAPCRVVTPDGTITYRDSHHLTRTFTMTLLDQIRLWVDGAG
ncbi:MAG: SGNH hydrolase domain-containing protein [Acidimicrobiales bacterium]